MSAVDPKDDAQRRLRLAYSGWPETVWRHHKGGLYRVDSVVVDEETLEFRVNYTSLLQRARGDLAPAIREA